MAFSECPHEAFCREQADLHDMLAISFPVLTDVFYILLYVCSHYSLNNGTEPTSTEHDPHCLQSQRGQDNRVNLPMCCRICMRYMSIGHCPTMLCRPTAAHLHDITLMIS